MDFRSNVLLVLATLLFSQSQPQSPLPLLICNEGFNISLYGIPLYHWAIHECDEENECFMQEITLDAGYSKLKDSKLRFGGCVSKELAPYISCKNMYGEDSTITLDVIFKLLHGLDSKTKKISYDFIIDSEKHLRQLFSRGGDSNEFIEGILDFLDAIGYSRSRLENPLNDFARCIRETNIARLESTWNAVLESLKVENVATVKLSQALAKFAKTVYDVSSETAEDMDIIFTLAPKLAYPALESFFGNDRVLSTYVILARAFENLDPNKPQIEIQDGYEEHFLMTVFVIQVLISDMEPRMGEKAYSASKNIIIAFQETYPQSAFGKDMMDFANILRKYAVQLTCSPLDPECETQIEKKLSLMIRRSVEIARTRLRSEVLNPSVTSATGSGKWKLLDDLNMAIGLLPPLRRFEANFSDFFSYIELTARTLTYEEQDFRREFSPHECQEIPRCKTDLCNRHDLLTRTTGSDRKDEL